MIRAIILHLALIIFVEAEVLPNANGGFESSGFVIKLTEAQWTALVGAKIQEKDGVSLFLSNSSKWSLLILYKGEKYFLLHNFLQFTEKYSIDTRGDPKNILLTGRKDNQTVKFIIDTEASKFLFVGF